MRKIGNKKIIYRSGVSATFSVLPTIEVYKEKELFEDAEVLMVIFSCFYFVFACGIKLKNKLKNESN